MEHFRLLKIIKTKQLMLTTMPMRANPSMRMLYHSTPVGTFITINLVSKAQLISKGLFSILNSSKKTNEKIQLDCYDTSGRLVFVRFSEEFEDTKKSFRN